MSMILSSKRIALEQCREEWECAYAMELQATDVRQRLVGSRIVSRTDVGDLGRDVKSLKRVFPCGGTMAAVVDDREDVWANGVVANYYSGNTNNGGGGRRGGGGGAAEPPENLLLVKPFHWKPFVGVANVNNAAGVVPAGAAAGGGAAAAGASSSVEQEEDEQPLLWTMNILKRLHARYFDELQRISSSLSTRIKQEEIMSRITVPNIYIDRNET